MVYNLRALGWDDVGKPHAESAQKNNASAVETGDAIDELRRPDSITPQEPVQAAPAQIADPVDAQARIAEAENFFNLLWRNVPAGYFGYLWTTPAKKTVPFDVSTAEDRHKMAVKAIELNDVGEAVYYGVNLLPFAPKSNERASKETVALQVATVADIDVEGGTHISTDKKKYPPTFDAAKSFLPFDVSILVDSGYGLHGLCIYAEPIKITADNRAQSAQRNKKFIAAIKARAGDFSGIDSVGDLSRVLRVPGTFNLKRGRDNAPMCRVVEVNDVRFTPEDMDTRLADLIPQETSTPEPPATDARIKPPSLPAERPAPSTQYHDPDPDYDLFRGRIMFDMINPTDLDYSDWLAVVSSCKNLGFSYAAVDAFNQRDSARYDAGANQTTWDSLNDPSFGIETLHGVAKRFGYSERDTRRQWYKLHPELRPSIGRDIDEATATEVDDAVIWLEGLEPVDLTAEVARDKATLRRLALAEVYCPNTADKFFDVLRQAKAAARDRLKLDDADRKSKQDDNPAEPLDDKTRAELSALVNVNISDIRARVKRLATEIADKRKKIIRRKEGEQRREAIRAKISARQQHVAEDLKRLAELRPQYEQALAAGDNERCNKLAAEMYRLIHAACDVRTDKYTGEITRYENSAHNLTLIFSYDPALYKLFARNEFTDAIELTKTSPWGTRKATQWTDNDDAQLRNYLAETYKNLRGRDVILDSVVHFANTNKFHPVRDYFKNLPAWDGKPRAETLFIDWLNVDDNTFTREATLKGLVAAVCRVFHPGCSFQTAIVLQGAQGIGKSFILERLGGQWYNAITDRVDDPHAVDALRLTWLAEFKEMTAMRKADVNAIKQFIELPADTRRFAYERRARTVLRQCVFFITVNDSEFLNDPTGARRFLILQSHSPKFGYVQSVRGEVFDDKLVAQIWAEVFARCKEMFSTGFDAAKLRLSPESERFGEEVAELFTRNDLEGEIAAFLDTKILPPVIWDLMTREERRKFFAQKNFVIPRDDLTARFKARRVTAERQAEFDRATKMGDFVLLKTGYDHDTHEHIDYFAFYGTEYRQHICAAEIYNEAFGTDKRKSQITIAAVLQHLDGWALGKRIQKDPVYGDMRKVFYRDPDNIPEPTDDNTEPTNDPAADPYGGEPVPNEDLPF